MRCRAGRSSRRADARRLKCSLLSRGLWAEPGSPSPAGAPAPAEAGLPGLFLPLASSTGPSLACFLHREELCGGYGETRTEKGEESWSPEGGGVGRVRWGGDQQERPLVTHTEAMPLGFFFFLPCLPLPRLREDMQEMKTDRNTSGRKQQERKK